MMTLVTFFFFFNSAQPCDGFGQRDSFTELEKVLAEFELEGDSSTTAAPHIPT